MTRDDARMPRGELAEEKSGPTADPGRPQPSADEVENARLLGNEARHPLRARGLDEDEIRRLADEFVSRDVGEGTDEFIRWAARQHDRRARRS